MWQKELVYSFFLFFVCFRVQYTLCQSTEKPPSPVIKKCHCEADEVQSVAGCQNGTRLQVNIWNKETQTPIYLDLSTMNSTIIQPLKCPDNMTKDVYFDLAFISTEGKLMIHPYPETDLYCMEYVINDQGEVFPRIERCTEKFSIRLCCQTDEYLDSSERCTKIPNEHQKQSVLKWLESFIYKTNRTVCEEGNTVHEMLQDTNLSDLRNYFRNIEQQTQNNFCLGMYGDENEMYIGVTFCSSMERIKPPTVPYCCEKNRAFDLRRQKCVPHREVFSFPVDRIEWPFHGIKEMISLPNCSGVGILTFKESGEHSFMPNGSLLIEKGHSIPLSRYCLGAILTDNLTLHSGLSCLMDEEPILCPWRWNISVACLVISSLFLVVTLIVYLGIPDLRRRIGGICLICELLALLVSQITLIVLQTKQKNFSPSGCLAAGIIEIIFVLASFFWLNIMCYDVWSTFRVLRPFSEKVLRGTLFLKYSIYGWGIPLLIGIAAVVVEKLDGRLRPNFSPDTRCFFSDQDLAFHWLYLYAWILLLLLVNLSLFVHLAFTLFSNYKEQKKQFKRSGGSMKSSKKAVNQDMENLKLHVKLFIIMGVPWLIEVFTSLASKEILCYIWFLDLLNLLRGFFIFVIFVCKKSARDLMIATWFPSRKPSSETSNPSRKTSTMSLSGWLSSFHGRKISKASMASGGNITLEALKEEREDPQEHQIKEENETITQNTIHKERDEVQLEEGHIEETKT